MLAINKYLLFAVFLCAAFHLQAQKTPVPTLWNGNFSHDYAKAPNDTLDTFFIGATPTLYASPNGGYVSGNSGYQERTKLQEFRVRDTTSHIVHSFIYWFGAKSQQSLDGDSSSVLFVFYDMDTSAVVNGVTRVIPRTIIRRDTVWIGHIDTSRNFLQGMYVWNIPPQLMSRNYAVGIDFRFLDNKDTIAMVSSTDGDARVNGLSWEFDNNRWGTIIFNWGLDIDFAVFPVIDNTIASLEPGDETIQASVYPNPISAQLSPTLQLDLLESATIETYIHTLDGKLLTQQSYAKLGVGQHRFELKTAGLPTGTYLVTLVKNGRPLSARKLLITP